MEKSSSQIYSRRDELQKQTNPPSLGRNKFYEIMNENKHKSSIARRKTY